MPTGVWYLALLRGINVGGKSIVKMADLRAAFEAMEFDDVSTYIQSGNVLFRAPRRRSEELAARIEAELERHLGRQLKVVLVTASQLRAVVDAAPRGFGADTHLCDVIFLRKPLTTGKAIAVIEAREGVDHAWAGKGVLYFSRLAAEKSRSRLSKIVTRPEYQEMTIRSWGTTMKLLALIEAASDQPSASPSP